MMHRSGRTSRMFRVGRPGRSGSDVPDVQGRAVREGEEKWTAGRRGDGKTWDDRFADNLDTAGRKTGKEKDIPHVSFRDL
jgi:hypothetical protein